MDAEAIFAMMTGGDDAPETTDPREALANLRECYAKLHETVFEDFEPGDICFLKLGNKSDRKTGSEPVVFVRYLDEVVSPLNHAASFRDITDWGHSVMTHSYDCVIGSWVGGDRYVEFLLDSKTLRHATPEEIESGQMAD